MTMPLVPPTIVTSRLVTMQYPYEGLTTTLQLPCPEFNDSKRLSGTRIYTETRGGELIIFGDETWAKDEELAWTFTNLTILKKRALELFIRESLGKEIKLTDHLGLVWKAIITTPDAEFVQDSPVHGGRFTVSLTFNVELVP